MNATVLELNINNLKETYEFNKVAKQASGAVLYRQGKAVLLATVAIDEKPVGEDFLPMTVQYIEKSYAAAKIPGGFIKRETKPGDFETLTSRIIDRSLRPLFPKGFRYPVVISVTVLSSDSNVDMQVAALHAASAALFVSDTPISQAVAAVRLAKIDGEIVLNPTPSKQTESTLDLFVVGSDKDVLMIEMRTMAQEIIDDVVAPTMVEAPLILEHHKCNELDEEALLERSIWHKKRSQKLQVSTKKRLLQRAESRWYWSYMTKRQTVNSMTISKQTTKRQSKRLCSLWQKVREALHSKRYTPPS